MSLNQHVKHIAVSAAFIQLGEQQALHTDFLKGLRYSDEIFFFGSDAHDKMFLHFGQRSKIRLQFAGFGPGQLDLYRECRLILNPFVYIS